MIPLFPVVRKFPWIPLWIKIVAPQILEELHKVIGRGRHACTIRTVTEIKASKECFQINLHAILLGHLAEGCYASVDVFLTVNSCQASLFDGLKDLSKSFVIAK